MSHSPVRESLLTRQFHLPAARLAFIEMCCVPLLLFFAWVLLTVWVGSFSARMMADDYFFGPYMHRYGFWGSCAAWYFLWFGRWFSQLMLNCVFSFGDWIVVLVPTLLLGLWCFSLALAIKCLTAWPRAVVARTVLLVLGLTLATLPKLTESVYWSAASLFHTLPLALCGFLVPCLWGQSASPLRLSLTALLGFCLSGSSETFTAVWVPTLLVVALWRRDKYSIGAALCAVAGALLMVLAPGNAVRASTSAPHWDLARLMGHTWDLGLLCLRPSDKGLLCLTLLAAFLTGLRSGTGRFEARWIHLVVCGLFVGFAAFMTQLPSVYGTGHIPVARVMVIPVYVLAAGSVAGAVLCGALWQQRIPIPATSNVPFTLAGALLLVASFCYLQPDVAPPWQRVVAMRRFAADWTAREGSLRAQIATGKRVVKIPAIGGGLYSNDVVADPTYNANVFMALHYSPNFDDPVTIIATPE